MRYLSLALPLLVLAGCNNTITTAENDDYEAVIRYTEFGVPHIEAKDYGSLGFGEGYAAATDQICTISYMRIAARGELAEYLGEGPRQRFVINDAVVRGLDIHGRASKAFAQLRPEMQANMTGYAAGFNHYLQENPGAGSWCQGAEWVQPVTAQDIYARGYYITTTLPYLAAAIANAAPPNQDIAQIDIADDLLAEAEAAVTRSDLGSNAWALGNELTEHDGGILLGNPHYPWFGSNRFWEKHLTIPGELDIYGVSLVGIPGVAIGFNQQLGWSHTVSDSYRLALYQLQLDALDPTLYRVGDATRQLEARKVSLKIKGEDGDVVNHEHTLWWSEYGPVVSMPGLAWTATTAFAINDVNYDNFAMLEQWWDMGRADSIDSFIAAHERWNAMPWVNTIATGREGKAVYLDNSTVGHLSTEAQAAWQQMYQQSPEVQQLYDERGLLLLDGSNPVFKWQASEHVRVPNSVPFDARPQLLRDDYVFNANDSYWLAHASERQPQRSPAYGPYEAEVSLRTQQNLDYLTNPAFRGVDQRFDLAEVQQALFHNATRAYHAFYTDLTDLCGQNTEVPSEACAALAQFTGTFDLRSSGAVLFREWLSAYLARTTEAKVEPYRVAFDSEAPLSTPHGIADDEIAMQALTDAVQLLQAQSIALDATLGEQQLAYRGEQAVAVHGGRHQDGVINMVDMRGSDTIGPYFAGERLNRWSSLTNKGYPITGGSSFILAVEFTPQGPRAEALLNYGQSEDPQSPAYAEQTELFAQKQWRNILFARAEIIEATEKELRLVAEKSAK
jgi:acyl-homoserine-lactone acylase